MAAEEPDNKALMAPAKPRMMRTDRNIANYSRFSSAPSLGRIAAEFQHHGPIATDRVMYDKNLALAIQTPQQGIINQAMPFFDIGINSHIWKSDSRD